MKCLNLNFPFCFRYIYGHGIRIDLTELYSTWQAGDKYLVHRWDRSFFDYIKKSIRNTNICLVYDQLCRIQRDNVLLDYVKELLKEGALTFFKENYFLELNPEALIDILKIDCLNIAEIDIVIACFKSIERQIVKLDLQPTPENKQKLFEPLKPYIRFTDLLAYEVGKFDELKNLLTDQEIVSLFLHLFDKSKPISIEYLGPRILNENVRSYQCYKRFINFQYKFDANNDWFRV